MTEDFYDAHERHYDDAEMLYAQKRWANADHLFGIAAECGLKVLSEKLKGSPLVRNERFHVNEPSRKPSNAWDVFESYRSGHAAGTKLILPTSNPFADWDVSHRYANRVNFSQATVDPHRTGAHLIQTLVITAEVEGLL
jgi:hypothetical protein